jgi:hypothetical protein
VVVLAVVLAGAALLSACGAPDDTAPPDPAVAVSAGGDEPATPAPSPTGGERAGRPIKLVFIHHSCGENWLADDNGGLGRALADAGYFVSDTNYGWGPDVGTGVPIGDLTDVGHWYLWFRDPQTSRRVLSALLAESGRHSPYSRLDADPGGANRIVMFKSCFPNSDLADPRAPVPSIAENELRGQECGDAAHTVAAAKGIYTDLLESFAARPDVLFVAITAPPLQDRSQGSNARAFNEWLVDHWLDGYAGDNVVAWDLYNVLTSPDAHHRVVDGRIEHVAGDSDVSGYAIEGDDHPSPEGNRKATEELVPFLDVAVERWQGG